MHSIVAKRTNPMLVVTLIALEAAAAAAVGMAVRSETGGPVADASIPPFTGPLLVTVTYRYVKSSLTPSLE